MSRIGGFDLVPVTVTEAMIEEARAQLPELPAERIERYRQELGLTADSARQLAFRVELGDYFERALAADGQGVEPQALANWVGGELVARIGETDPAESKVAPEALASLVGMVSSRAVTPGAAKQVLDRLASDGGDPARIVETEELGAIAPGGELDAAVDAAIAANPEAVDSLRAGRGKAIGAIIGHVMRETKGRADGGEVTRLVRAKLDL